MERVKANVSSLRQKGRNDQVGWKLKRIASLEEEVKALTKKLHFVNAMATGTEDENLKAAEALVDEMEKTVFELEARVDVLETKLEDSKYVPEELLWCHKRQAYTPRVVLHQLSLVKMGVPCANVQAVMLECAEFVGKEFPTYERTVNFRKQSKKEKRVLYRIPAAYTSKTL